MHDDQHGTAIVLLAALRGACAVQGRALPELRIVISGGRGRGGLRAHPAGRGRPGRRGA